MLYKKNKNRKVAKNPRKMESICSEKLIKKKQHEKYFKILKMAMITNMITLIYIVIIIIIIIIKSFRVFITNEHTTGKPNNAST